MIVELRFPSKLIAGEQGDVMVYRMDDKASYDESNLLRHVARELRQQGFDVVKKRMALDRPGTDADKYYIKTRKRGLKLYPQFYVDNAEFPEPAYKAYNRGELRLRLVVTRT